MINKYLLLKRGLYWGPNRSGYTGLKREAGRYDEVEARALADEGEVDNVEDSLKCFYGVFLIVENKAPRFAPKIFDDLKARELERLIEVSRKLVRKSIKCEEDRRAKLKTGSVAAGFCDGRLEELKAALAELEDC